jgi:hypothetical protein
MSAQIDTFPDASFLSLYGETALILAPNARIRTFL